MNDEEFERFFAKVLGQVTALGVALIGYRGVMRSVLGYESFWWFDVVAMFFGIVLFLYFQLG